MLKYIVIELCKTSTSFCHYNNHCLEAELISLDDLQTAIIFSMKQNLNIQFLYPDYQLPLEYTEVIESIDHIKIMSSKAVSAKDAKIIVLNGIKESEDFAWNPDQVHILRISKNELHGLPTLIEQIKQKISRLNVILTDIESFSDSDLEFYKEILNEIEKSVEGILVRNESIQINFLTDRIALESMNNCNAGCETITVAPNGKFYICPAFYHENSEDYCGDLVSGLNIKNPQLYRIDHAPICKHCDAWHCKRCVWLNRKMTLEVNTPSYQQCVLSHIERNISRDILENIKKSGYQTDSEISKIDYLDPFEKRSDWK